MSNRYIGGVVTETTNVAQSPWSGSWTEQAAMQGFGSVLKITNSLRFRSSASAYLSRTPASAGNQQTWTWSGWVKRGSVSANGCLFAANPASPWFEFFFHSSGSLYVQAYNGSTVFLNLQTTPVYRDPSAWYHIVLVYDATNATASNRVRLYVNNVQVTAFGTATYPSQNTTTAANGTAQHAIGGYFTITDYFDGYLAEVNFIDGQALDPTAFGAINKETGVWAPIAYTGTYGLNGFRLPFTNGTSTTTLGYDTSGNGNNWTTNNISLTAGSTYDWMIDSPSKIQGTGYGVGNYAVLNPLQSNTAPNSANLEYTATSTGNFQSSVATIFPSTGKWYMEFTLLSVSGSNDNVVGIVKSSDAQQLTVTGYFAGATANSYGYYASSGNKFNNGSGVSYGASFSTNDVIGVAFDADAGTLVFYKNNTSQGTAFTGLSGSYSFVCTALGTSKFAANFGQRPFAYTPPTGYKTLCTQNLPVATIYNGASYMAATIWTGDGSNSRPISNTVNGVGFTPDFVWVKGRGTTTLNHALYDSVRGSNKNLSSSTTGAETSPSTYGGVGSFDASGFTLVNGTSGIDPVSEVNKASPYTYVGWSWKAGGTAVTNTAGSITSSVSANTTAGFSVVTWTGTAASAATVGHGLGVAPSLVIIKQRNGAVYGWITYHSAAGAGSYLVLNQTYAATADSAMFNNTAPTSSVFTLSSGVDIVITNPLAGTMVAYCFAAIAGYSAFGSYTGNGSADGPFVFLGFRPRWLLVKRSSTGGNYWILIDTSRGTYNVNAPELYPNSADPEAAYSKYDILSNGFKLRDSAAAVNASGDTYIYACFAENPFSVSLAR